LPASSAWRRRRSDHLSSRWRELGCHEPTRLVRPIAERPGPRMATTAQGDLFLACRQRKGVAEVVDHFDRSLTNKGAVLSAANDKRLGHGSPHRSTGEGLGDVNAMNSWATETPRQAIGGGIDEVQASVLVGA